MGIPDEVSSTTNPILALGVIVAGVLVFAYAATIQRAQARGYGRLPLVGRLARAYIESGFFAAVTRFSGLLLAALGVWWLVSLVVGADWPP